MSPETQSAVNDIHELREYRAIKPEIELMMKKAAMFSESLELLELVNDRLTVEMVYALGDAIADMNSFLIRARAIK